MAEWRDGVCVLFETPLAHSESQHAERGSDADADKSERGGMTAVVGGQGRKETARGEDEVRDRDGGVQHHGSAKGSCVRRKLSKL
jgi:hypothetical protein